MKIIAIKLFKTMLVLIGIEVVLFVVMVFFTMSDEPTNPVGRTLYLGLKYVLGFPLVLINDNYPFFLDSKHMPKAMIPLVLINNLIQAGIIVWIRSILKKSN